ncbi:MULTISPECIES: hypothetical protein [unclassified Paenibacillus]|uniref:hypothetical protein n=1 Tax=unclassified Paenibacillus TaxID=185978 RepID=UPI000ADF5644|nr:MULTISPECIES: hypothetical protein [unclassified Paenibacillus]
MRQERPDAGGRIDAVPLERQTGWLAETPIKINRIQSQPTMKLESNIIHLLEVEVP